MPGLSRRNLLAAGAAAALPMAVLGGAKAEPLRIGAVLPIAGPSMPPARVNLRSVGEAARMGLILGEEEASQDGERLGRSTIVTIANAPGAEAAARAARRLVARAQASVLVGGFTREDAEALAEIAEASGAVFFNIAAQSDALRKACRPNIFHVEASAAMYLDAIFDWFAQAGSRKWYLVYDDGPEGRELYERALARLSERGSTVEVVGRGVLRQDNSRDFSPVIADIGNAKPEVVMLLTDWRTQLEFLSRYEVSGLVAPVAGYPDPASQMRDFYLASRQSAPVAGSGRRAALWEATLDTESARTLNTRFEGRWGRPMDPPAWAAYQAVRIASAAWMGCGGTEGSGLAVYLTSERRWFDVGKGIGATFDPQDRQMRQSLYFVRINPETSARTDLEAMRARASFVGESPGAEPTGRRDERGKISSRTCA